jgi:hypothetical protein
MESYNQGRNNKNQKRNKFGSSNKPWANKKQKLNNNQPFTVGEGEEAKKEGGDYEIFQFKMGSDKFNKYY